MKERIRASSWWTLAALGAITVVLLGGLSRSTPGSAQSTTFLETFNGNPSGPQPWRPSNWDVQKHVRGPDHWQAPEPLHAQHGPDCAAPPADHLTGSWDDLVFLCRDHLMTALNASDYGVLYLTPPALLDFSQGPAVLQWEMSTERMSTRDWIDVTISPWADNVARPLLSDLSQSVDLQGPAPNAVHLGTDDAENAPLLKTVRAGAVTSYNTGWNTPPLGQGIVGGTNEAATRQTFKLTVQATRVKFERLASATAPALVFFDQPIAALAWTAGVVQFGHHSYTPTKDNAGVPGTWHWDNIQLRPAVPFTIIPAGVHLITSDTQTVRFPQPAPAGALLRFAATSGTDVQVSFDGGPFQAAQRATQPVVDRFKAVSYFTPVPQGTSSVRFRGTGGWWGSQWRVEDPHLWARNGGPAPSATPSPTPTASPSPSATPTPTPSPTPRPSVTPTPTPRPSATPTPTPTPTPRPSTTPTPSPSPTPSPTPGGYTQGGFTTSASVTPPSVSRGSQVDVAVTVLAAASRSALVDIEIYSPSGAKVYQQFFDSQTFVAGQPRTYTVKYTVPTGNPTGTYTVKVGIFGAGWNGLLHWNDGARTFTVTAQ